VSKKVMILTGVAGVVSFAGAFVFAWLSNPSQVAGLEAAAQSASVSNQPPAVLSGAQAKEPRAIAAPPVSMKKALTEQQLKSLAQDLRQKMQEYEDRLQAVAMQERRLQVAQNVLKEDIENLDNLRVEVAATVTSLRSEREKLLKSRLEIDQKERENLISIAATYDTMDATGAGKILASMCKPKYPAQADGPDGKGGSYDDAVKIMHYMTERTKGKLLAELATSEPALAAGLCQRLKQIV